MRQQTPAKTETSVDLGALEQTHPVDTSEQPKTAYRRAWLFRLGVVLLLVGAFAAIRLLKAAIWPEGGHAPEGVWDVVVQWGAIGWLVLLPWAIADVAGWLIYRRPVPGLDAVPSMSHEVVFRIVTRGSQPQVAAATVENILETMERRPLFPFIVEVVTDIANEMLPYDPAVFQIVVPAGYETSNGATHKARALQYAIDSSPTPDEAWILHLDEESHITEDLVAGIRDAVSEEEASGEHRVGQGLILYHRDLDANPVFTLADSIRVGDDLGRFHFQYRLNSVLFGMHGSFVLVRNSVEREVGFDFTPPGCTTEDTTWGLHQMDRGRRFRWVDGYVVEQSPRRLRDFLKQRRRWFTGMWWAAVRAPVAVRHRVLLVLSMALWSVAWFNLIYSWIHLFNGVELATPVALLGDLIFTVYIANYLLGIWVSLGIAGARLGRKLRYAGLQMVLLPMHALIEAAAVGYSFVRPERSFHVVAK